MSNCHLQEQNKGLSTPVLIATLAIHQILQEEGYAGDYVFDGRVARELYGDPEGLPHSVEILFLKPIDALWLKQFVPTLDPHSFWYTRGDQKLQWHSPDYDQPIEIILTPPFSTYASSEIFTIEDLPVPPYSHLMLSYLWRWAQLRQEAAHAFHYLTGFGQEPQEPDKKAIERQKDQLSREILSMHSFFLSRSELISVNPGKSFDKHLRGACQLVVEGFCKEYPMTRDVWGRIGIKMGAGKRAEKQPSLPTTPVQSGAPPRSMSTQGRMGHKTAGKGGHANGKGPTTTRNGSGVTSNTARRTSKASTFLTMPQSEQESKPSKYDIRYQASQTTIEILEKLGYRCALFGSMACKLYGNGRIPEDVDILVIPPESLQSINDPRITSGPSFMTEQQAQMAQEHIKSLLVTHCPPESHYILVKSKNPKATHKVLYWVPSPPAEDDDDGLAAAIGELTIKGNTEERATTKHSVKKHQAFTYPPRFNSTKVDILVPPSFSLPLLPPSLRSYRAELPCVPYPLLLAHKLNGWANHKERLERAKSGADASQEAGEKTENRRKPASNDSHWVTKVSQDVSDLKWLIGGLGTYGGDGRGGGGRSRYWSYWERIYQVQERLDRGGGVSQYWHWDGSENAGTEGNPGARVWKDRRMFSREFEEQTRERIQRICDDFPDMVEGWRALGFDVN